TFRRPQLSDGDLTHRRYAHVLPKNGIKPQFPQTRARAKRSKKYSPLKNSRQTFFDENFIFLCKSSC
ncbi:hypothetical protein, partial [Neisseria sp. oral taxon 020]|uniref:hypothetical protein n=1 Tax=Neisseria sp. oral taxon 020 TaxID=712401 RepID=UPI001E5BFE25